MIEGKRPRHAGYHLVNLAGWAMSVSREHPMVAKSLLSPAARRARSISRLPRCDQRYPMQPAEHRMLEMRCLCRPMRRPPASESRGPPAIRGAPGWAFSLAAGSGDDHGQREWCSPDSGVSGFRGCPFTRFRATMRSVGSAHNGPRIKAGYSRPGRHVRGAPRHFFPP